MRCFLLLFIICWFHTNAHAVEGYKELTFGMSIHQAFILNLCDLKEEKIPAIKNAERYNDFACENLLYEGRRIPLTIQFIDDTLQRIVMIVSNDVDTRKAILEELNKKYGDDGYEYRGNVEIRLYKDKTVQAAIFNGIYPSLHIIFQSLDYLKLIEEKPKKTEMV